MNRSLQPEAAGNAGSIPGGAAALGSMNLNLRLFQQRTVTTVVVSNKQTNRKLSSLVSGRASTATVCFNVFYMFYALARTVCLYLFKLGPY